jgi:hypothetical protein
VCRAANRGGRGCSDDDNPPRRWGRLASGASSASASPPAGQQTAAGAMPSLASRTASRMGAYRRTDATGTDSDVRSACFAELYLPSCRSPVNLGLVDTHADSCDPGVVGAAFHAAVEQAPRLGERPGGGGFRLVTVAAPLRKWRHCRAPVPARPRRPSVVGMGLQRWWDECPPTPLNAQIVARAHRSLRDGPRLPCDAVHDVIGPRPCRALRPGLSCGGRSGDSARPPHPVIT